MLKITNPSPSDKVIQKDRCILDGEDSQTLRLWIQKYEAEIFIPEMEWEKTMIKSETKNSITMFISNTERNINLCKALMDYINEVNPLLVPDLKNL